MIFGNGKAWMQVYYQSLFGSGFTITDIFNGDCHLLPVHIHSDDDLFATPTAVKCVLLIWIMPHADTQSMSLFAGSAFAQVSNDHPSISSRLLTSDRPQLLSLLIVRSIY